MTEVAVPTLIDRAVIGDGDTAYVLGCGPSAVEGLELMDPENCCLAVNKAILLDNPCKNLIWFCEDNRLAESDWFEEAFRENWERTCFCGILAGQYPPRYRFNASRFTFREDLFMGGIRRFGADMTYGGATVACRAMQQLALLGVPNIVLVGVDMRGREHWDGTRAIYREEDLQNGDVWRKSHVFSDIVRWVQTYCDSRIFSLTPTAINVPQLN